MRSQHRSIPRIKKTQLAWAETCVERIILLFWGGGVLEREESASYRKLVGEGWRRIGGRVSEA